MDLTIALASLGFAGFVAMLVLLVIWLGDRRDARDPFEGVPAVTADPEADEPTARAVAAGLAGTRIDYSKEITP